MEKELIDYIRNSTAQGYSLDDIRKVLVGAGWEEKDIEEAIDFTLRKSKPNKKFPFKSLLIGVIITAIVGLAGFGVYLYIKEHRQPVGEVTEEEEKKEEEAKKETEEKDKENQEPEIKNYGDDFNSFISATINCSLAKVKWVSVSDIEAVGTVSTMEHDMELKGLDPDGKCIFIYKRECLEYKWKEETIQWIKQADPTITDEQIKQEELRALSAMNQTRDVVYTCHFDTNHLFQTLTKFQKDVNNVVLISKDHCKGVDSNGQDVLIMDADIKWNWK